jgi:uncharacterized protein (DUF1330 family)
MNWKGGIHYQFGYRMIKVPDHPYVSNGYVREHRLIMERHLGRYLTPDELVHHIDGDKLNNQIDNLLLTSMEQHRRIHNYTTMEYRHGYSDESLRRLYLEGFSTRDVAHILGVSKSAIGDGIRRLGIARTHLSGAGRPKKAKTMNEVIIAKEEYSSCAC